MSKIAIHNKKNDRTILTNKLTYPELVNESLADSIGAGRYNGFAPTTFQKSGNSFTVECIVDGYVPIKKLFHKTFVRRKVFVDLILQIAEMIKECERTKITVNNLDLRMETIFMKPETHDVMCVYWPIVNFKDNKPPQDFLLDLPYSINFDPDEGGHYVEQYIDFLKRCKPFSPDAFLSFAQRMYGGRVNVAPPSFEMSTPNMNAQAVRTPAAGPVVGSDIEYNPLASMKSRAQENNSQAGNSQGARSQMVNQQNTGGLQGMSRDYKPDVDTDFIMSAMRANAISGRGNSGGNTYGREDSAKNMQWSDDFDATVGILDANLFGADSRMSNMQSSAQGPGVYDSHTASNMQEMNRQQASGNMQGMNRQQAPGNMQGINRQQASGNMQGMNRQQTSGNMQGMYNLTAMDGRENADSFGNDLYDGTVAVWSSDVNVAQLKKNQATPAQPTNSYVPPVQSQGYVNKPFQPVNNVNPLDAFKLDTGRNNTPGGTDELSTRNNVGAQRQMQMSQANVPSQNIPNDYDSTVSIMAGPINQQMKFRQERSAEIPTPPGGKLIRVKDGKTYELTKVTTIIGNSAKNSDFVVDNKFISRKHACIIIKNNKFYLMDMNSTNKTYLDGVVVMPSEEKQIVNGSRIKLANEEFIFFEK